MALTALFTALLCVLAPFSLPVGPVPLSLANLVIWVSLYILGPRRAALSVLVYLLLGAVGLPVFSAFQGGPGALAGPTGGYLWGFLAAGLVYWGFEKLCKPLGVLLAIVLCYTCGCLWFMYCAGGTAGFVAAVVKCVLPYLIPDAVKLWLAYTLSNRIGKHIK